MPCRVEETLEHWRVHTRQHLALLQSSLPSDHQRMGRTAELQTELADVASLQGVRWAMVIDQQLRVIGSTRLGLDPTKLALIDPDALAEYVRSGRVGWLGDSSARQLVIYPLDRTTQTGAPLREALLVEFDFAPVVAQTRRDGWFYLAQTLSLWYCSAWRSTCSTTT
ncbi:Sensor domain-containing diguanylate cyclase OS=Stutzerimonas stutzeri OX=316 GN=CXK95_05160 PE=4 SV=1 [Stutzerimonas stutzeri]